MSDYFDWKMTLLLVALVIASFFDTIYGALAVKHASLGATYCWPQFAVDFHVRRQDRLLNRIKATHAMGRSAMEAGN